jgi:hypothetical protein
MSAVQIDFYSGFPAVGLLANETVFSFSLIAADVKCVNFWTFSM